MRYSVDIIYKHLRHFTAVQVTGGKLPFPVTLDAGFSNSS